MIFILTAEEYLLQGVSKYKKQDYQGALADYDLALQLNPNYAAAYNNRGLVRADLGDKQGALADYNQALHLDPKDAYANIGRGLVRADLRDRQGALADFQQGATLAQQQGNEKLYQIAQQGIKLLQQ